VDNGAAPDRGQEQRFSDHLRTHRSYQLRRDRPRQADRAGEPHPPDDWRAPEPAPETRNEADLVHTTLFRYGGSLSDPEQFLAMVEDESANATSEVDELVISKELVYPSLETEVLERLPLAPRTPEA
jgi:hypothetical protein